MTWEKRQWRRESKHNQKVKKLLGDRESYRLKRTADSVAANNAYKDGCIEKAKRPSPQRIAARRKKLAALSGHISRENA